MRYTDLSAHRFKEFWKAMLRDPVITVATVGIIAAVSHNGPGDAARAVAPMLALAEEETERTFLF